MAKEHLKMVDLVNVQNKRVSIYFALILSIRMIHSGYFVELPLSQIIGEYGPSRDFNIPDVKCKNLQMIIGKVHR